MMYGAKIALRSTILFMLAGAIAVIGTVSRLRKLRYAESTKRDSFLLIRLDLLGDVVFALSAARGLKRRFPRSRVTIVTLPQTSEIAVSSPDVDEVITMDTNLVRSPRTLLRMDSIRRLRHSMADLRRNQYDAAISLYGRTASLLALLSRSRETVGYRDEAYRGALDRTVNGGRASGTRRWHDSEFETVLLDAQCGREPPEVGAPAPRISLDPTAAGWVSKLLAESGIGSDDFVAVFHIGSGYGDFKRWPLPNFVELAHRLNVSGIRSVIAGGPGEEDPAAIVANASPAVSLAGRTSVRELIALLDRADVVISGDSGPLHLATALGTAAVAIFGPTDPIVNGPIAWNGQDVIVLRRDIACSPCYSVRTRAECPLGDPICMRLVTLDEVFEAVRRVASRSFHGHLGHGGCAGIEDQLLVAKQDTLQNAQRGKTRNK